MNSLQLYRQGVTTVVIPIDEQTQYFDECMGRFDIQCQFYSPDVLDIRVDDYIIYNGVRFTINVPYQIIRDAVIQYNINFEHPSYWLKDITFRHLNTVEFSFFGTPRMLVQLIVDCMNTDDAGWMVGACEDAEEKTISFFADTQGYSCKAALQKIAADLQLEYWFSGDGKTLNLTKQAGQSTTIHFAYGRTKGLYSVERGILDTPLYNRIYSYGSTKNIPEDYRDNAKRLLFESGKIDRPLAQGERRRETSVVFDDIYPERTGTITAVSVDFLSVVDSSLDFDLNGDRIDGEQAKVVFKTGELGGKEFEISSYSHGDKTIRIKTNTESDGYVLPNVSFCPKIGDKYTLVGISQPKSYIDSAEQRLYDATLKAFKTLSRPPYKVVIDEKYMRENGFTLKSGDRVRLKDDKIAIDDMIRVTSVSFPIVNPYQCTVVISDNITYTQEIQNIIDTGKVKEEVKVVNKKKAEEQRRQALRMREMQDHIFNPETGYFDETNIRPNSIETLMLSVGAKSQNFYLEDIRITPNVDNDENKISITAGKLIHREIQIEGLGYMWNLGGLTQEGLIADKSYYLSAKCSKTQLTGQWILSENPIKTDAEPGYYHFNCGLLYSVLEGRRDYAFTNGMTYINGDTIRTGKVNADFIDVVGIFAQIISVGTDGFSNAGISGMTDQGNKSIRFWAGANEEDRYEAPFQVFDDGEMRASIGRIGKLRIMPDGIYFGSTDDNVSNLYFTPSKLIYRTNPDDDAGEDYVKSHKIVSIDTNPISQVAMQIRTEFESSPTGSSAPNIALALSAFGSPNSNNNIALRVEGNIQTIRGNGLTRRLVIDGGGARWYHILVQNGLIVNFVQTNNSDDPF